MTGAIFAGASYGIGEYAAGMKGASAMHRGVTRAFLHGTVGGIRAKMNGDSFDSGFATAGVASAVGDWGAYKKVGINLPAGKVAMAAVIGGTTSKITGGKFANGAITAAFVQAYNHNKAHGRMAKAKELRQNKISALLKGAQDGHITLEEAKAWYKHGSGKPLTADLSKIDFGSTSAEDFPNGVGSSEYVNTFFKDTLDGNVYGSIKLTLATENTVTATFGYDTYDFNVNWSDGRHARNVFTKAGDVYHGAGTPFRINLQGTGTLNP